MNELELYHLFDSILKELLGLMRDTMSRFYRTEDYSLLLQLDKSCVNL